MTSKSRRIKGRPKGRPKGRKRISYCVSAPIDIWKSIDRIRSGREKFTSRGTIFSGFFNDAIPRPAYVKPKPLGVICVGWFIEVNYVHKYEDFRPALIRHNGTQWEFVHPCNENINDMQYWNYIHIPHIKLRDEYQNLLAKSNLL